MEIDHCGSSAEHLPIHVLKQPAVVVHRPSGYHVQWAFTWVCWYPTIRFRHVLAAGFQRLPRELCFGTLQHGLLGESAGMDHWLKCRTTLDGLCEATSGVVAKPPPIIYGTVLPACLYRLETRHR